MVLVESRLKSLLLQPGSHSSTRRHWETSHCNACEPQDTKRDAITKHRPGKQHLPLITDRLSTTNVYQRRCLGSRSIVVVTKRSCIIYYEMYVGIMHCDT